MTDVKLFTKENQKATAQLLLFTGLSGAGKTTYAHIVKQYLDAHTCSACLLDGDTLRNGLSKDLGFSDIDCKGGLQYFTGITSNYDVPQKPDITINTEKHSIEQTAEKLIKELKRKGLIN